MPDLEQSKIDPEFKKTDCCTKELDCKAIHWDPDGKGRSKVQEQDPMNLNY